MKRISTFIILLITVVFASAQSVTNEEAFAKAKAFVQQRQAALSKGQKTEKLVLKHIQQHDVLSETSGSQLFMYNIGDNNGFVIVSADERTPDILGYADSGSIDPDNMPENMRSWLEMYAREIASLSEDIIMPQYATAYHPSISPLITATWNQSAPYNLQCPTIDDTQCVTGCVATAMAQALSCARPEGSKAIASRNGAPDLPNATFDWNIIKDNYDSSDKSASAQEVAKLMRYCGQAAGMEYGTSVSNSVSSYAADGLKKYFNISNTCHIVERQFFMSTAWDETIYNELRNNRPVIIGGRSANGGGHSFVCDGYDGEGNYHINWGWGGLSNGYFHINALSPSIQGIGGTNSGYNNNMDAIIGIKAKDPSETEENISVLYIFDLQTSATSCTRTTDGNFNIPITYMIDCQNNDGITTYDLCWGVFDSNGKLLQTSEISSLNFTYGTEYTLTNIALGNGLSNGTYTLKFLSRQHGATTWGMSNNMNLFAITMSIDNNDATLTLPQMSGNTENYDISDVKFIGSGLVNKNHTIEMNVKNTGDTFTGKIYIIDYDANKIIGSTSVNFDPGDSDILRAIVKFPETGTRRILFYKAVDGRYARIQTPVYTFDVTEQQYTTLSVSGKPANNYTIEDGVYIIDSKNLEMQCTVNNSTAFDYNSFLLYGLDTGNNSFRFIAEGHVNVPANNTISVTHPIMELEENVLYNFYLSYYVDATQYQKIYKNDNISIMYRPTTDAISTITTSSANDATYQLDGRRIDFPTHGIYIRNGKKFVVK